MKMLLILDVGIFFNFVPNFYRNVGKVWHAKWNFFLKRQQKAAIWRIFHFRRKNTASELWSVSW